MDDSSASQAAPFPPKSFESNTWVGVYEKLREDIKDAFEKMGPDHMLPPADSRPRVQTKQGTNSTKSRLPPVPQLLKHRLQITVRKPNQAHFSVVDIPGLISSKLSSNF
jgi:hypothetical protein